MRGRSSTYALLTVAVGAWLLAAGGGCAPEELSPAQKIFLRLPFGGTWHVEPADPGDPAVIRWSVPAPGIQTAEDHPAFGWPVLAPAAGTVVHAEDGFPDRDPGDPDLEFPLGNHVVIDHHTGEYSVIGGFQAWSLVVGVGSTVHPGALLGLCGNSGDSGRPSIRYHLSREPSGSPAVPALFRQFLSDGRRVVVGTPQPGVQTETLWKNGRFGDQTPAASR